MLTAFRTQRAVLFGLLVTTAVALLASLYLWYRKTADPVSRGKDINREAWELSFVERGFAVPASGPREGYWGSRLGRKIPHAELGWREAEISVPGLVEVDGRGFQYYKNGDPRASRVLILGGSVAFGAYASQISKTYFYVIGAELERRRLPVAITIIAAGAWKSTQEVTALKLYGRLLQPDLVVLVDGLNDLTNGATARALYGERVETADGSEWTPLYHAHDYRDRVKEYFDNINRAAKITAGLKSRLLVVLQPSLAEKARRTSIENVLLDLTMRFHGSAGALSESYQAMRGELYNRSRSTATHFLDSSRIFKDEGATTFSDIWHFSDFGHDFLGKMMARSIALILSEASDPAERN